MQFEGIKRSAMKVKGQLVDLAVYAIVRADFA
jgi:RimJ/RimL family protein N-acetyltransferase